MPIKKQVGLKQLLQRADNLEDAKRLLSHGLHNFRGASPKTVRRWKSIIQQKFNTTV